MATQILNVANELRRRITSGVYGPDERLIELQLSAELGVSRTPIRLAFEELTKEGLLERLPKRGFKVKAFNVEELINAIDVRGTLEGMAARLAAERGLEADKAQAMRDCVEEGWTLLDESSRNGSIIDAPRWSSLNARFHAILVQAAGNAALSSALEHISTVPLAGAGSLVVHGALPQLEFSFIQRAQQDHADVLSAIENREGNRAEGLMREHARRSRDNKRRLFEA